jgi:hypothetical protein
MLPLRDIMPALGQGLSAASASRDPGVAGTIDVVQRQAFLRDAILAGLNIPLALTGDSAGLKGALRRMDIYPHVGQHMREQEPLHISGLASAAPGVAAGLTSYLAGESPLRAVASGAGNVGGATLAEMIARAVAGPTLDRAGLAGARIAGALGGQYLARQLTEDT